MKGLERQRQIYLDGAAGIKPIVPVDYQLLRAAAKDKLRHEAFTYIDGGAGSRRTLGSNSSAFEAYHILPRMLHGNADVQTKTTVLGQSFDAPVLTAPVGVLELAHPKGDIALAQACHATGTPLIISSQASFPMEDITRTLEDTPRWFQLYWSKSDELVQSFIQRAEACGCTAVVVTLDTTVLGWRTPDLDAAFLPFAYAKGIAQYTSDPVFRRLVDEAPASGRDPSQPFRLGSLRTLWRMAKRYPGSTLGNITSGRALKGVRKFGEIFSNPALSWEHIEKLRSWTDLPILLKGILHPDDARKSIDAGVQGIVVSNHGGRQIDGSVSSFEMLPEIVQAVGDHAEILFDSGIRTGSDIFKCLALGAKAVCIGRPFTFGLAVGGARGAEAVLRNLTGEFEVTMLLAGCKSIADIDHHRLKPSRT